MIEATDIIDSVTKHSHTLLTKSKGKMCIRDRADIVQITEEIFTEDAESIVINERYAFIEKVCRLAQGQDATFKFSVSDKIDQIVTNRILALPIFAVVMYLVYYLSIQTVGQMWTDWANDCLLYTSRCV